MAYNWLWKRRRNASTRIWAQSKEPEKKFNKRKTGFVYATKSTCFPFWGGFGVAFFFISLIFTVALCVIVFRAALCTVLIEEDAENICTRSKNLVSVSASILNIVAIKLLKIVYRYIALWLTHWENPRAKTDYANSLVLEIFWFELFITYSSIFYVALSKKPLLWEHQDAATGLQLHNFDLRAAQSKLVFRNWQSS